MKTKIILSILLVTAFAIINMSFHAEEAGLCDSPVVGDHSGAPGETNCTYCHSGNINSGLGLLELHVGNDSTYVPGQTYSCIVKMQQDSIDKFGFVNLALQNVDSATIGNFNLIDSVRTRKYSLGGKNYFSHTPCGADADTVGKIGWYYTWTAPATNVGSITFYISALAANHNHATTGDSTYTREITLIPQISNSIYSMADSSEIFIGPNPAGSELNIILATTTLQSATLKISDIQGKVICETKPDNQGHVLLNTASFNNGIYFLHLEVNGKIVQRKFLVAH